MRISQVEPFVYPRFEETIMMHLNRKTRGLAVGFALAIGFALWPCASLAQTWKAGAAKIKITPEKSMWMSGYASRDHGAEGTLIDLYAKALVLEDATGKRCALVTLDLVGIDRDTSLAVRQALEQQFALAKEQVAICCSHTHCGPVVGRNLMTMYMLDEAQASLVKEYTAQLEAKIAAVVGEAVSKLAPCSLAYGTGWTTFAVNRRNNVEANVPQLRIQGQLKGPVDYDVPVLAVRDPAGQVVSVVFGYACHSTVMAFFQWSGDYPGFAQLALEEAHPGAIALFWAGCGGDQNPLPRRLPEHAPEYGKRLAGAVDGVLGGVMRPVEGNLATTYQEVELPLGTLPTREELEKQAASTDKYQVLRAKQLLSKLDANMPLSPSYPYPVQIWKLGNELLFVTLGGEVVVDYALRIKHELGASRTWVAAYSNDVMAYIPSRRVLLEGGYEGAGAMVYYGLPTSWAPEVEEVIVRQVHERAAAVGVPAP